MIHYLLIQADGKVFQRGIANHSDSIPRIDGLMVEVIKEDDPRQPWSGPEPTYVVYRAMAYPSIGEQLDVLWKVLGSMDSLKDHPDLAPMLERIRGVKDEHPKKAS